MLLKWTDLLPGDRVKYSDKVLNYWKDRAKWWFDGWSGKIFKVETIDIVNNRIIFKVENYINNYITTYINNNIIEGLEFPTDEAFDVIELCEDN